MNPDESSIFLPNVGSGNTSGLRVGDSKINGQIGTATEKWKQELCFFFPLRFEVFAGFQMTLVAVRSETDDGDCSCRNCFDGEICDGICARLREVDLRF